MAVRAFRPGHYLTIGQNNGRRGTYYKVSGASPNLLTLPGVRGVQVRFQWRDLEPTPGAFTFGPVQASYDDADRSIRAELWRVAQNNSCLIVLIEDKTFNGQNPMPSDLDTDPLHVQAISGGYCAVRWNTTVQSRFRALLQAVGDAFDADPSWYAVALQETAIGFTAAQRTTTGYSDAVGGANNYADSQIANLRKASDAFPTSQVFWYTNYFPTPATDYRLQEIADNLHDYNGGNSGVVMGGPDILPDATEIETRCYPRYRDPPVGSFGELKQFCSMQFDSYDHLHTTTTPDARIPGATWTVGTPWTMDHMYRFGRDSLRLNYVMWENNLGTGWKFLTDASSVIAANQTFNPSRFSPCSGPFGRKLTGKF